MFNFFSGSFSHVLEGKKRKGTCCCVYLSVFFYLLNNAMNLVQTQSDCLTHDAYKPYLLL